MSGRNTGAFRASSTASRVHTSEEVEVESCIAYTVANRVITGNVRTVPRGVRGSGVPVRSSADTVEGFGEVIDQRPETPSVPSICGGPSGRRSEVQARGE